MARALPPWLHEQQSSETITQSSSFLQSAEPEPAALLPPPDRFASARQVAPSMSPIRAATDKNQVSGRRVAVRIARKYTWAHAGSSGASYVVHRPRRRRPRRRRPPPGRAGGGAARARVELRRPRGHAP